MATAFFILFFFLFGDGDQTHAKPSTTELQPQPQISKTLQRKLRVAALLFCVCPGDSHLDTVFQLQEMGEALKGSNFEGSWGAEATV